MTDVSDFLDQNTGDFSPGFKFANVGDTCKGVVVGAPRIVDNTDLNGNPQRSLVVDVDTDDGTFAVWLPSGKGITRAVSKAVKDAGATGIVEGAKLAVKYTGNGEATKPGFSPPKLFEAKYEAPKDSVDLEDF